ncbi:PiggyBac transposable element-derived protein 4 [Plakobranchus ocellatus]|uniref:PiggyBac transposable element-derived protein 4 n=1 Tax=Plakobranchus ocellatus TaxID=259542 RepID=A0AAV4B9P5_9GAST|nr:PiggyBac transposable element-derived protein 4 [Plakobranchus ocellatus]
MHNPQRSRCQPRKIVLTYNKTKRGVDATDQMAHAFTTKTKIKWWLLVMFFNILNLASIASRVVSRMEYPMDTFSHEDNRKRSSIDIGRSLAFAQIKP